MIEEYAGQDATRGFDEFGHSTDAKRILKNYLVGELVEVIATNCFSRFYYFIIYCMLLLFLFISIFNIIKYIYIFNYELYYNLVINIYFKLKEDKIKNRRKKNRISINGIDIEEKDRRRRRYDKNLFFFKY